MEGWGRGPCPPRRRPTHVTETGTVLLLKTGPSSVPFSVFSP